VGESWTKKGCQELTCTTSSWAGLGKAGSKSAGLYRARPDWAGLRSPECCGTGLDYTRLGLTRERSVLNWAEPCLAGPG
jgi:hypothetical protein